MSGYIVETSIEPSWKSVEDYRQHVKKNDPISVNRGDFLEADYHCTCCHQAGPHSTGALLKFQDMTPTTIDLQGDKGATMWLCADCYYHGVRPKFAKFGKIRWNAEGRRIRKRYEKHEQSPW